MRSILQLENKLRKTKSANKIITSKKEIKKTKEIKVKAKKTKIEAKIIKRNTRANTRANATTTTITTIITTTNRKYLLKLRKQFVCIYINFVFKTMSLLLSYLLLFNNL